MLERCNPADRTPRGVLAVLLAVMMITSVFAGAATAQQTGSDDGIEPADEVYVDDDGNAVLVYEESDGDDDVTGELGVDVAEGILYALVTDDIEEDVSAAFEFGVTPDSVAGAGEFTAERPDEITDFAVGVSGVHTREENSFDASLDLTVDASEEPSAAMLQQASTSGTFVTGADTFSTSGEYAVEMAIPVAEDPTGVAVEIDDHAGGYTLDVTQQQRLDAFEADGWQTEADARQTLEAQFGMIATQLGGDATITIQDHEFTEAADGNGGHLDVSYTVEYENVEEALGAAIATSLAEDPDLDLTEQQAQEIADAVVALELDEFAFEHSQESTSVEGEWDVELGNVDQLAHGVVDLMEAGDDGELDDLDVFEDARAMIEAQQDADLTQTGEWSVSIEQSGTDALELSAELSSEAENWDDYVSALEDRGVEQEFDVVFDLQGETEGDELVVSLSMELDRDDLLDGSLTALIEELEDDPTVDDDELAFWNALESADLEVASVNVDMADGTVTMTAGAKFDDLSAFEDVFEDEFDGLSVAHLYADLGEDDSAAYVYVDGMVDPGASEDDVRAHAAVDDETTVHLGADLEELPKLDIDEAEEFLSSAPTESDDEEDTEGTEEDDADDASEAVDDEDEDSIPGFGPVVAIVAVLSAALLLRRD